MMPFLNTLPSWLRIIIIIAIIGIAQVFISALSDQTGGLVGTVKRTIIR